MSRVLLLCLVVFLVGCKPKVEDAPLAGDTIRVPAFEWRVQDRAGMEAVYINSGMEIREVERGRRTERDRLHGFVGKSGDVSVVYTLPPKTVDDVVACTLGHEVMHLALGDYHP